MKSILDKLKIDETFSRNINKPQKVFNKVKNNIPDEANYSLMSDLLFLPTTKEGYKYLFVVVDLASNKFDVEPIKDKTPETTTQALKNIFKRGKYVKGGETMRTDSGNEFKGVFNKYLIDNEILHKTALPGRHTQLANVDALCRQLGRLLNGYMNSKELKTNKVYKEWVPALKIIIPELNKVRNNDNLGHHQYPFFNPTSLPKFKVGDIVHQLLNHPESALGHKQPTAKFREGDFKYSKVPKAITKVIYMLDPPYYRYLISGITDASFSENQLMKSKEKEPKFVVQKIIDDRKIKGKVEFLIKWKGYANKDNTWEPLDKLIKDGLKDEIDEYLNNK